MLVAQRQPQAPLVSMIPRHTAFVCLWMLYLAADRSVYCWSNQMAVAASKAALSVRSSRGKLVFLVYLDDGSLRRQELANFMWSLQVGSAVCTSMSSRTPERAHA